MTRSTSSSLNEAALRRAAGSTSYDRGEDYVRYVHGLRIDGETASGSIQARRVYLVDLDWSGAGLDGTCTCPHHARGNFCKHLVALGLAALDQQEGRVAPRAAADADEPELLVKYLAQLEPDALRDLVVELAIRNPDVERILQVRAASALADPGAVAAELTALAQQALSTRGFVDYRRSFDVARDAHELLDELETHLDGGAADAVRPALLKALTRLRTITLRADDSSGAIGDACQRAADLYARSCREGSPDRVRLAKWLLKFRDDSPGWPVTTLADFVEAFDDKALTAYRNGVAALDAKHADSDHRFEVDTMMLELADHDGDVDRAVELLAAKEHEDYAGIVDRLRAAGREDEAFEWLERAVAAGRVSSHQNGRHYWLSPEEVAEAYVARGRPDDALEIQRAEFARRPEVPRFRALIELAKRVGDPSAERARAFATLESLARQPYGSGAARVQIALAERDLEGAWTAAQEFGVGYAWQELAGALAADFPGRAAELYQPRVDKELEVAQSSKYAEIAATLAKMKELCDRAGEAEDFAAYLDGIRSTYGRRPSLMAALDRRGL